MVPRAVIDDQRALNLCDVLRHGFRATFLTRNERDVLPFGFQADLRTFDRDLFIGKGHTDDYYVLTDVTFDFPTGPCSTSSSSAPINASSRRAPCRAPASCSRSMPSTRPTACR